LLASIGDLGYLSWKSARGVHPDYALVHPVDPFLAFQTSLVGAHFALFSIRAVFKLIPVDRVDALNALRGGAGKGDSHQI
jgi:hypothetical protein